MDRIGQYEGILRRIREILPEMKLNGLAIEGIGFDFYTASFRVIFAWNGKSAVLSFPEELVDQMLNNETFTNRRLKKELHAALGLNDEKH